MNRVASVAILCLLSASAITGLIQAVKADGGAITINADGSITPSTAPIYSADNITYTLTGNITANAGGIVVGRDNIVLDGAGYTVMGSGSPFIGNGTTLTGRSNVTVGNMTITNFADGIYLVDSSDNTLSGNNVTANKGEGVVLETYSDNNTLSGNNIADNYDGIGFDSNSGNTLSGNDVTANTNYGILLNSSSDNVLSGNNVTNNGVSGILVYDFSFDNSVSGNNVTANSHVGIEILNSAYNTFSGNNAANNLCGVFLASSSNNVLSGNNITNSEYGIEFRVCSNNFIFYDNFVNNTVQVYTDGGSLANVWDDGSRGNYWSDYLAKYSNASQVDSSGVWNTPYVIDTNNTDNHPLMVQYEIPEFPSFLILPFFFVATLLTVIICKKKGVKTRQSWTKPGENATKTEIFNLHSNKRLARLISFRISSSRLHQVCFAFRNNDKIGVLQFPLSRGCSQVLPVA